MLRASSKEGKLITLATLTKEAIEKLRNSRFFCPVCKEEVIIKAGSKVIPHFAHRSKVNCLSNKGGEGEYHEKGKLVLFQWLKKQQLDVGLEVYIPEINQIPDILIYIKGKRIAIEYQCSKVDVKQLQLRNDGYRSAGIIPIWILGANQFKRQRSNRIKIDQFIVQCIHQFNASFPLTLFFLCPHTLQFISFQHLALSSLTSAYGQISLMNLKDISFKDIFNMKHFSDEKLFKIWEKEKRLFRLRPRKQLYGNEGLFNKWLYQKNTHIEYLPSIVHLPVQMQFKMKTPTWDWQSRLCIDILHPLPIGGQFTLRTCINHLKRSTYRNDYFPLVCSPTHPIKEYLRMLEYLKVIIQLAPNQFKKIKPILFHRHIESAIKGDKLVIQRLLQYNSNSIEIEA